MLRGHLILKTIEHILSFGQIAQWLKTNTNNKYIYIGYSKKVKKKFSKRFDICLHQSILFTTHLKNFYYILQ